MSGNVKFLNLAPSHGFSAEQMGVHLWQRMKSVKPLIPWSPRPDLLKQTIEPLKIDDNTGLLTSEACGSLDQKGSGQLRTSLDSVDPLNLWFVSTRQIAAGGNLPCISANIYLHAEFSRTKWLKAMMVADHLSN